MKIATNIKTGKVFEGRIQGQFFISSEIGSGEYLIPRDSGAFFEWRSWTQKDHDFNLPTLKFDTNPKFNSDGKGWIGIDEDGNWESADWINKHWKIPTMRQCKKQTTYAVIYKNGQVVGTGSNEIYADVKECPRDMQGCVSGEGYHLCKEVCKQKGHAEVMACEAAGDNAIGGTLYLIGHTCCCDNCINVMADAGIFEVVICDVKENNRFSPMGAVLAKRYEKMSLTEFIDAVGGKTVENVG